MTLLQSCMTYLVSRRDGGKERGSPTHRWLFINKISLLIFKNAQFKSILKGHVMKLTFYSKSLPIADAITKKMPYQSQVDTHIQHRVCWKTFCSCRIHEMSSHQDMRPHQPALHGEAKWMMGWKWDLRKSYLLHRGMVLKVSWLWALLLPQL